MIENKKEVFETLYRQLINYPAQHKAYGCLMAMCEGTLKQLEKGSPEPASYSRRTLKIHVDGRLQAESMDSKDLNKWIQLKDLNGYLENFIRTHPNTFERLAFLPVLKTSSDKKGGRGNETLFWLDVSENLTTIAEENDDAGEESSWSPYITYTRAPSQDIQIAFFLKPFFKKGQMLNKSVKGLVFWTALYLSIAFAALYMLALSISLVTFGQKIASLHLFLMLGMSGVFAILFKDLLWPIWLLPDYRIIKAPTAFLGIMEMDADIEMHRDEHRHHHTRFTRFEATCSICGAHVRLKTGKPDQASPLVGRCNESPHAHVYSFDRVNLTGVLLNDWAKPINAS